MFKSFVEKYFSGLTKNSILLAFASLFSDISTEMLYPILPVYLTEYLKANGSIVGIIEGIAQATQNIIQGLSGWLSDKLQQRKPIALVGYLLPPFLNPLLVWQIPGSWFWLQDFQIGWVPEAVLRHGMHCLQNQ